MKSTFCGVFEKKATRELLLRVTVYEAPFECFVTNHEHRKHTDQNNKWIHTKIQWGLHGKFFDLYFHLKFKEIEEYNTDPFFDKAKIWLPIIRWFTCSVQVVNLRLFSHFTFVTCTKHKQIINCQILAYLKEQEIFIVYLETEELITIFRYYVFLNINGV